MVKMCTYGSLWCIWILVLWATLAFGHGSRNTTSVTLHGSRSESGSSFNMHDSKVVPIHPWKEKLSTVYIVVGTIVAITLPVLLVLVIFYACWRTRTPVNPQEADGPEPAVVGRRPVAARRLDQRVIELFPMLSFPGDGTVGFGESGCQICCDEFVHGEGVRVLPACSHIFHNDCITKWLTSSSTECPICRHDYLGV